MLGLGFIFFGTLSSFCLCDVYILYMHIKECVSVNALCDLVSDVGHEGVLAHI